MRVFISHLLNENDINPIFEMIETRHLDTSNNTTVIGEVHLLNLIIMSNNFARAQRFLYISLPVFVRLRPENA